MKIDQYKVFLASPSDTEAERVQIDKIVQEINGTLGSRNGYVLRLLKWEDGTYPDFGEDGQDVINKQVGDDYNIFIGIMWKKFGSPTKRAGSGTAEEFERAYSRLKGDPDLKIMFYFNNAPISQDTDLKQFEQVKEFKAKVAELGGLYKSYAGQENFSETVRTQLFNCVQDLVKAKTTSQSPTSSPGFASPIVISPQFEKYLNDIEIGYAHSQVDEIKLEDVYIAPDLRELNPRAGKGYKVTNLKPLSEAIDIDGFKYVLLGNDAAGKTANMKYLYMRYFNLGLTPVLLNGKDINGIRVDAIRSLIDRKLAEQYQGAVSLEKVKSDELVLLIDDFQKAAKGKNRYWPPLIKAIESITNKAAITGNSLMPIKSLDGQEAFEDFDLFSIQEFGPKFRYELTRKWYELGGESKYSDSNEIRRKIDTAEKHIKTIIGKGYVPAFPFYILSILQALETSSTVNQNYSIHGFYYEHLINESLGRSVKDKNSISLYYNYLTYFCYYLFEKQESELSLEEFKIFHIAYCEKHDIEDSLDSILAVLEEAKLIRVDKTVYPREKYIYYFFTAKYLANNISKQDLEAKSVVSKMSKRIFKDEYSAIVMFLTHLSKDTFIIDELIRNSREMFPDSNMCRLEEDVKEVNKLNTSIPELVLERIDVDEHRNSEVEQQEEFERLEKEFEQETSSYDDFKLEDDISDIDLYAKITLALKTVDILGQIAKKYWGELDGDKKQELVEATYSLGLRTLGYYLQIVQVHSNDIVEHIEKVVREKHIKDRYALKKNIEETTSKYIFKMCFMASWGVIKRVSNSIGYDKLKISFEKVLVEKPYNSTKLIDLSIKLGYSSIKSQMPIIDSHQKLMKGNNIAYLILRNLAVDHLYMFDTDFKTRTKICQSLDISEKEQLRIDATSTIKRKKTLHNTRS
jgi:hypothetical protein